MLAFIEGLAVSLSLIVAIGPQNAYVLRQGLLRRHVLAICLVCTGADMLLFALGIGGVGQAIEAIPGLGPAMALAGAVFLAWYAWTRFAAAFQPTALEAALGDGAQAQSLGVALRTCLAFTFLNPHVYLDTLLLFGGLSARYPTDQHVALWAGASLGSALFFFGLGYLARALAPVLARPERWRWVEILTGIVMTVVSLGLLSFGISELMASPGE